MIPLPIAMQGIRTFFSQSKIILIAAVLCGSHYFAYMKGREHFLKEQARVTVNELDSKAAKAVAKAADDSKQLSELRNKNEKLLEQIDKLNTRTICIPTDDELRILEGVYEDSKH